MSGPSNKAQHYTFHDVKGLASLYDITNEPSSRKLRLKVQTHKSTEIIIPSTLLFTRVLRQEVGHLVFLSGNGSCGGIYYTTKQIRFVANQPTYPGKSKR